MKHIGKARTYNPKCKCENCEWAADQIREQKKDRENEPAGPSTEARE